MKFLVRRTLLTWPDNEAPVPGAIRESYTIVDRVGVSDPRELYYGAEHWYRIGTNHRVERGEVARDREVEGWFFEIESLSGLLDFVTQAGREVIITEGDPYWSLEIYDDYRE